MDLTARKIAENFLGNLNYEDYLKWKEDWIDELENDINNFKDQELSKLHQPTVSKRLLAEKIILALDDYGRKMNALEYGLPIDPDTKSFESKRPQEMLGIVMSLIDFC